MLKYVRLLLILVLVWFGVNIFLLITSYRGIDNPIPSEPLDKTAWQFPANSPNSTFFNSKLGIPVGKVIIAGRDTHDCLEFVTVSISPAQARKYGYPTHESGRIDLDYFIAARIAEPPVLYSVFRDTGKHYDESRLLTREDWMNVAYRMANPICSVSKILKPPAIEVRP